MLHPESELSADADRLATYARALNGGAGHLHNHPELVYQMLEGVEHATRNLQDVLEAAASTYRTHAGTAVTVQGDELAGSDNAVHIGGYLVASAQTMRALAAQLMRATAEAEQLFWPKHDPVAAERLADLHERLGHRTAHVTPDADLPSQGVPSASRIDRSI